MFCFADAATSPWPTARGTLIGWSSAVRGRTEARARERVRRCHSRPVGCQRAGPSQRKHHGSSYRPIRAKLFVSRIHTRRQHPGRQGPPKLGVELRAKSAIPHRYAYVRDALPRIESDRPSRVRQANRARLRLDLSQVWAATQTAAHLTPRTRSASQSARRASSASISPDVPPRSSA